MEKTIVIYDTDLKQTIKKYRNDIIPSINEVISLYSFERKDFTNIKYKNYTVLGIKHNLIDEKPDENFFSTKDFGEEHIIIFVKKISEDVENILPKKDEENKE